MEGYFYDFHYFLGRKNGGSFILGFNKELPEDEDEKIEVAVNAGALPAEYADDINYVDDLTEAEAKEIVGDDIIIYTI